MLRGAITPGRAWWDLLHYDLSLTLDPDKKQLRGTNSITFRALDDGQTMQIDLQVPMRITSVQYEDSDLEFSREGNVYWLTFPTAVPAGTEAKVTVAFAGQPRESKNPPWSGGLTWQRDSEGNHFIATSCYGDGASLWWPCKDHLYDEPDQGVDIHVTVPESLVAVSNGRLRSMQSHPAQGTKTFHWKVTQPINNYCVNLNVGNYESYSEQYSGEGGTLDMHYWVLRHDRDRASKHFLEARRMIEAFEYWFGKYPFYEDGYKLVQVPYLGMEHQSSVTYGNGFQNGYRGRDLSQTGVGLKFDFIIVHESGHEWFGNNISMKDSADMWIHESFTNYSENLFVEYFFTQQEAEDYVIGCRQLVRNDKPIVGPYHVNTPTVGDTYYKGGNMLHTIRHVVDNDIRWRRTLRGLNETFYHQTVDGEQVRQYMSQATGRDLSKIFKQYLFTTEIPMLKYRVETNQLAYWYEDVVDGFAMPLKVKINDQYRRITPTKEAKTLTLEVPIESFDVDRNFYVRVVPE